MLVDGAGGVYAGSSGDNIVYNAFAFENIRAVGTAGVVQNTWREIVRPAAEPTGRGASLRPAMEASAAEVVVAGLFGGRRSAAS